MISKELLSEILGYKVDSILSENTSLNPNGENIVFKRNGRVKSIDIYKLAFKAKEWAIDLGYEIFSNTSGTVAIVYGDNDGIWDWNTDKDFKEIYIKNNETEAIFKACEWVRKRKNGVANEK